jgi:hypothetical protein
MEPEETAIAKELHGKQLSPVKNTHAIEKPLNGFTMRSTPRRTLVRELHKAFSIPYIYDYITKLSRQQAEGI